MLSLRTRKYYRSLFGKLLPAVYMRWKKWKMRSFYNQFIKPGNLCFDIGASTGLYAKTFLELGARVIAVEPLKESYDALCDRLKEKANFLPLHVAVSAQSGTGEIFKGPAADLSTLDKSFVTFNEQQSNISWSGKQTITLVTLDDLIERYGTPHFCKIDVEGHEKEVLTGLSHRIPFISFEFIYPFRDKAIACIHLLHKLAPDSRFNFSLFEFFELENNTWKDANAFIEQLQQLSDSYWTGDIVCKLA